MTDRPYEPIQMISLRLNIRRDGSVVLTDRHGVADSEHRQFPPVFFFEHALLLTHHRYVELDVPARKLVLRFANAVGYYDIAAVAPNGFDCVLDTQELGDAPPIDEDRAAEIAVERREQRIDELVARAAADGHQLDRATAASLLGLATGGGAVARGGTPTVQEGD